MEYGHNPSPSVIFTSVLSDRTYVEARYSGFYGDDHGKPLDGGDRVRPRFYDLATGNVTGKPYYWYDGSNWKTAFAGKISHLADNFLGGSHDFKFGIQYNSGGSDYNYGNNDFVYFSEYDDGSRYGYGYTQTPFNFGGEMNTLGLYTDDTFRVNDRLTLNLGLRYDHSKAFIPARNLLDAGGIETGQKAPALDNLYTWNSISPRIGFNLKLTNDGKTVLRGHYGRYYRAIVTSEYSTLGPSYTPRYAGVWDFEQNRFDPDSLSLFASNENQSVDSGFKNPYTDQFIIGFERELTRDLGVQLNYVHKKGRNYGGWRDLAGVYAPVTYVDNEGTSATGATYTLQQLVSDPSDRELLLTTTGDMFTNIDAVSFQVNKRMSNHWQMTAALTYLDSRGRLPSSAGSPTAAQTGQTGIFSQNPNDLVNTDGKLIGDRPWTFRTQLVYEAPKGFLIGANYTYQSGRPYARTARVTGLGLSTTILAEPITGDRSVGSWNLLDLRLQKSFKLGGNAEFALFGDLLNSFNDDAYESVLDRRGTSDNFAVPSRFLLPRRLMVGAKFRF